MPQGPPVRLRCVPTFAAGRGLFVVFLVKLALGTGASAVAQVVGDPVEPVPGFRVRVLDLNQRFHEAVSWTDIMLNGRGISHHDVQLDITDVVQVADLGRTRAIRDDEGEVIGLTNGQFWSPDQVPLDPLGPDQRYPYRDLPRGIDPDLYPEYPEGHPDEPFDPYGTYFPGGEGHDFGALVEADVTIPPGRWQIAIGNSGPRWLHLTDIEAVGGLPSEDPLAFPLQFYDRINEHQRINAGLFGMFENVVWYDDNDNAFPTDVGWTAATIEVDSSLVEGVTTKLSGLFAQTDGFNGFEIAIRDASETVIRNPGSPQSPSANIGENNRLFPERDGWVLLQDMALENANPNPNIDGEEPVPWRVMTLPVQTDIDVNPEDPGNVLQSQPLEYPVVHVSGQKVIGPTNFEGELNVFSEGEPQAVAGQLKLRRYYVPDHEEFNDVVLRDDEEEPILNADGTFMEEARVFVGTIPDEDTGEVAEPRDRLRQPIAQGFVDVIAWQNGEFYPPAMGFPFARQAINDDPDDYGVLVEGQILLPEDISSPESTPGVDETNVIRFKDGNRSFAGLIVDLDGDGEFLDEVDPQTGERIGPIIDDDEGANPDGGGFPSSPISRAKFTGDLSTINGHGEPNGRWRSFQFFMSDNPEISGADSGLLAWDQNEPEVYDDTSPFVDPFEPLQPEHVIGPENFRTFVDTIESGELVLELDELFVDPNAPTNPDPNRFDYAVVFEVDVESVQWDSIGLKDILPPDYVILDPSQFETRLDFGFGRIVVDLEGDPFEGLTIDLVDETVETILVKGEGDEFWTDEEMLKERFLFTAGTPEDWDVSEFLAEGILAYRPLPDPEFPDGDYNANGRVEQADLDLVLLNWNEPVDDLPSEWVHQRPTEGIIDQAELDGVLLHWNETIPSASAVAVPEPSSLLLVLACAALAVCRRVRRAIAAAVCLCAVVCGSSAVQAQTVPAPGFVGRLLDVSTPVNTHSEGLAFLRGIGLDSTLVESDVYDLVPVANFAGSTPGDYFLSPGEEQEEWGEPYPGGQFFPARDDLHFVGSLEAAVTIPEGTWQIAFGTGDGGALQLDGFGREIEFFERQNNRGRLVGRYFDMVEDTIIYNDNRVSTFGSRDRGWVSGTFTVPEDTTARFFHSFHTLHGNHLSEVIIRDASGGSLDITDEPYDPAVDVGWELLQHGTHGWDVRADFAPLFGPINRVDPDDSDAVVINPVRPIDHIGGRRLIGSALRSDGESHLITDISDQAVGDNFFVDRTEKLLLKRYSIPRFDDPSDHPFKSDQSNPFAGLTIEAINEWIVDQQQADPEFGPDHLGYIGHLGWESFEHYPEALGFDDPFGDEDNYMVVIEGQLLLPVPEPLPPDDPDNPNRRLLTVRFKDGTSNFSGLQVDAGEYGGDGPIVDPTQAFGETIIEDGIWTGLNGTAPGSPIAEATFDFTSLGNPNNRVEIGDQEYEYRDFRYYTVAGEDELFGDFSLLPDTGLLAWDLNNLPPRAPEFPQSPGVALHPAHMIRPESVRLRGDGIIGIDEEDDDFFDADEEEGRDRPELHLQARLAKFEDAAAAPMVAFEVDPVTGRSDTVGIEEIDMERIILDPTSEASRDDANRLYHYDVDQIGILDVDNTHILLELWSEPEDGFTFDILEGSVDQVEGEATFHFLLSGDPNSLYSNPAAWDTSRFYLPESIGQVTFRGLPAGAAAAVPEPSTLVLALMLLGIGVGHSKFNFGRLQLCPSRRAQPGHN